MDFHICKIVGKQCEDDVEHLLIVTLRVGVVTVGHRAKECLQELDGTVHVIVGHTSCHVAGCAVNGNSVGHDKGGHKSLGESYAHFVVGNAEGVIAKFSVMFFDGDITALIQ